jgi:predicted signal transduction protein with EAL and GGDEF domain
VAEGVERRAQLEFLCNCGPIAVQGYLLGQPVEAAAVAAEAQAAAARVRAALGDAPQQSLHEAADALVFVGAQGRRRLP